MNDDSTLAGQIALLSDADMNPVYTGEQAPAAQAQPADRAAVDPNSFQAQMDALAEGQDVLEYDDESEADASQPADQDADPAPASDPYASLSDEEKSLLALAQSPLGKRLLDEGQKLIAEHGSPDQVLSLLNAPQIDEQALAAEAWSGPVAALLNAKDEYGEAKYDPTDPLIQTLVGERFERLKNEALMRAQLQNPVTQAQSREAQIQASLDGVLKMYPSADPEVVKTALLSGGDPAAAARRSHAHVENQLTQARAQLAEANAGVRKSVPAPLRPGGRAPAPTGATVPNPFTNPRDFAALERKMIAEGNRARK